MSTPLQDVGIRQDDPRIPICTVCKEKRARWMWRPGWEGGYCSRECFVNHDKLVEHGEDGKR
jgi:hypothetical protein